jgi:GntR family transcriptional regulator
MLLIDPRSTKPIYEQIADGLKENILKGLLLPGEKLPSIREMSGILTVNPNTVSKAYSELERQRVIETISGRGTFVSSDYSPKVDDERLKRLKSNLKDIVIEAHYIGLDRNKVMDVLNEIYLDIERE